MRWAIGDSPQCDAALRRIFGADLDEGRASSTAFLQGIGVKTDPSAYGVSHETNGRAWWSKALEGERGRNFIGGRRQGRVNN